ncbi:MAG TPA: VOC family protein [Humisphaera sp.]
MTHPRLNLVVLRVADLVASEAFYARLGLSFERHRHGSGPEHLAAQCGGAVVELYAASAERPVERSTRVGFAVDDVRSACEAVRAGGAAVLTEPAESPWGSRAVVRDPDGRAVELVEARSDEASRSS